ncbi:MAG: glycoside hydrolase family 130 protein [Deltaproteobacteria bacterium]|nr:glycoside hydrolase family 130 protein [Deltaproteobacteria bacterium]
MSKHFPFGYDILYRFEGNPIITIEDIPFRCNTVFNGTVVKKGEEYFQLLRVEGQQGYSVFALAKSKDGLHFSVEDKPVMTPARRGPFAKYETRGIEDPRITVIDGVYYVMYTAYSEYGTRIALAKTDNFYQYNRVAIVSEPGNKDGILFPEMINGEYVRLDRPIGKDVGNIWVSYSKNLTDWGKSEILMTPRHDMWDSFRIGASVPPIKTEHGWFEIYHGVKMTTSGPIYRIGTVLMDLEEPHKVISRCDKPILSPREDYERIGDVGNVAFACGAVLEDTGEIKVYYGAADTCICVATTKFENLILQSTEILNYMNL